MKKATKPSKASKVRAYQAAHPNATATDVAKACGITPAYVYAIRHDDKKLSVKVPKQLKWRHVTTTTSKEPAMPFKEEAERIFELTKGRQRIHPKTGKMLMEGVERVTKESQGLPYGKNIEMIEPKADNVNHPAHYKVGGIETIDFIEAKGLSYHLGNVVKYIARADSKGNRKEDLLKAQWYLNREIAKL